QPAAHAARGSPSGFDPGGPPVVPAALPALAVGCRRGSGRCRRRRGRVRVSDSAGIRLLEPLGAHTHGKCAAEVPAAAWLRPARHGQHARGRRDRRQVHVLPAGIRPPLLRLRAGPAPGSSTRPETLRQPPSTSLPSGPTASLIPEGWVHNLEHGGLVILYKGAEADQTALRALYSAIPVSPVCGFQPGGNSPGPVIARFDQMAWPYAALVWDRVLPMQTIDQAAVLDFYARYGERNNPEKLCNPSASPSGAPSASPAGAASPAASDGSRPR